jgi:hypothetical protein
MHVVQYPVRGGESLNVVAIVHGEVAAEADLWDHSANAADLAAATAGCCAALREVMDAIEGWRLWVLHDRAPMQGAHQHAVGRVALLGDAAHPMRPYLAQGAGMAIEDAAELGHALAQALDPALDVPTMLQRYALNRWQRNARVQARALRNGQVFHADGVVRWGRDFAMKVLGERVLDMPWSCSGGAPSSEDGWPGSPGMRLTFFASPKKVSKKRRPAVWVPTLRFGQPAVLEPSGVRLNSPSAQTTPALIRLSLRSSAQPGRGNRKREPKTEIPRRQMRTRTRQRRVLVSSCIGIPSPPLWMRRGAEGQTDQGKNLFEPQASCF